MATMNGTKTKPAFCSQSGGRHAVDGCSLRIAAEPAEHAGRDDERHDELHDADAEIAEAGIDAPARCPSPPSGRRRRCSPSRRRSCRRRSRRAVPARGRSSRAYRDSGRQSRCRAPGSISDQVASVVHSRPPKIGTHEGVEDAQRRAGEAGQCGKPEELLGGESEADRRQLRDDDRPNHPHRERQQQARDRDPQIAPCDRASAALPEVLVLRPPVLESHPGPRARRPAPGRAWAASRAAREACSQRTRRLDAASPSAGSRHASRPAQRRRAGTAA